MSYAVYLYNIPQVSEDGTQALPVPESQTQTFENVDQAKMFAQEQKLTFDRVVLMQEEEEQRLVERYVDGQHETPETIVRR
ncbi:MAG: hypothetical protein AAGF95_01355 [Chloroflexota bacterium]